MSHVAHMNESNHTCECVMSHIVPQFVRAQRTATHCRNSPVGAHNTHNTIQTTMRGGNIGLESQIEITCMYINIHLHIYICARPTVKPGMGSTVLEARVCFDIYGRYHGLQCVAGGMYMMCCSVL